MRSPLSPTPGLQDKAWEAGQQNQRGEKDAQRDALGKPQQVLLPTLDYPFLRRSLAQPQPKDLP